VSFHPLKGERVSKVIEGIPLNLALYHSSKESREAASLLLRFASKKLSHDGCCGLADRASMAVERDLGDGIARKFEGQGYLISTQWIVEIDFAIRVK
jgi:hypothetical protein